MTSAQGSIVDEGTETALEQVLRHNPPAIYFDDGSFLRGPGGHVAPIPTKRISSRSAAPHRSWTRRHTSNSEPAIRSSSLTSRPPRSPRRLALPETILPNAADLSTSSTTSLLQYATRQVHLEGADFIFCDDAAGEKADVIAGWLRYGLTQTPNLRLIHCKAKSANRRPAARLSTSKKSSSRRSAPWTSPLLPHPPPLTTWSTGPRIARSGTSRATQTQSATSSVPTQSVAPARSGFSTPESESRDCVLPPRRGHCSAAYEPRLAASAISLTLVSSE